MLDQEKNVVYLLFYFFCLLFEKSLKVAFIKYNLSKSFSREPVYEVNLKWNKTKKIGSKNRRMLFCEKMKVYVVN
jgi:hypothetical protein